jgi:polyhydroxyalkanoate synthesis regulator phasin
MRVMGKNRDAKAKGEGKGKRAKAEVQVSVGKVVDAASAAPRRAASFLDDLVSRGARETVDAVQRARATADELVKLGLVQAERASEVAQTLYERSTSKVGDAVPATQADMHAVRDEVAALRKELASHLAAAARAPRGAAAPRAAAPKPPAPKPAAPKPAAAAAKPPAAPRSPAAAKAPASPRSSAAVKAPPAKATAGTAARPPAASPATRAAAAPTPAAGSTPAAPATSRARRTPAAAPSPPADAGAADPAPGARLS